MKITKFSHSCILVEEKNARILFDPGMYSQSADKLQKVDAILITHEHQDHIDIELLKKILENNKDVKVLTSRSVSEVLRKENISSQSVSEGEKTDIKGVKIECFGKEHAIIYKQMPCENICFLINDKLYHPGDSFTIPNKHVEILALPVEAPWMKVSEAVDFALALKSKIVFPIHDARMRQDRVGSNHRVPKAELEKIGSQFIVLEEGKEYEI